MASAPPGQKSVLSRSPVVAVKIHVAAALQVFKVNTVTGFKGIETRGRQGLFEKIAFILFEQVSGGSVDVLSLPLGSQILNG